VHTNVSRTQKGCIMKVKKLATAVAIATPISASLIAGAHPANAALPERCSSDLCMKVTYESGNVATIYMWARSITIHSGHFELSMPNGRVANSNQKTWTAGGAGYTFADWNGGIGLYCGTLWSFNLDIWENQGNLCLEA
jgi:hypothetical protein